MLLLIIARLCYRRKPSSLAPTTPTLEPELPWAEAEEGHSGAVGADAQQHAAPVAAAEATEKSTGGGDEPSWLDDE